MAPIDPGARESGRHLWQITALRELALLLLLVLLVWFLYALRQVFLPVFVALLLAYVCNPLVSFLEARWRWPRPLTTSLLIIGALVALAGVISWFGPLLFQQGMLLARKLPEYLATLAARYHLDVGDFTQRLQQAISSWEAEPQQALGRLFSSTGRAVGIITLILSTATHWIVTLFLTMLYFFFFSWRFNKGLAKLAAYIPESRKLRVFAITRRMDDAVGEFFRGRLLIALVVGIILSTGWYFSGVPYWFFLGIVTGLLNIVPYLSIAGWPIAVALKYVDSLTRNAGASAGFLEIVVWPSVVYGVAEFLEGWVLTPWIQSGQTNLSAIAIVIIVFIGGALAGIWGMLLAIPIAACVKILWDEIFLPRIRMWARTH